MPIEKDQREQNWEGKLPKPMSAMVERASNKLVCDQGEFSGRVLIDTPTQHYSSTQLPLLAAVGSTANSFSLQKSKLFSMARTCTGLAMN